MRLALIDGDVIVYAAGFASDGQAKRDLLEQLGGDKAALEAHIEAHGLPFQPVEYALQSVKQQIKGIVEASGADDYVTYLSHPVNFREGFFEDYKANRDITHKPHWADEIKEYLLDYHHAVFSELGDEADDALGMAQMRALADGRETVICSIDKDLNMIPGLHYNWSKNNKDKGVYLMEDPECLRLFYMQMITGDTADNIPGLYRKLGIKATADWLAPLEVMEDETDMYEYVLDTYRGDEEFVKLNGTLLWIKRDPEWYVPPTKVTKRKVVYG